MAQAGRMPCCTSGSRGLKGAPTGSAWVGARGTGDSVEWWQIVLIVVGAVAIGLAVGYLLNILFARIVSALRKARPRPVRQSGSIPQGSQPQVAPSVPDLYAEIEYNRRLATAEWSGQLQPFQTRVWDSRGEEVHSLAADVRSELSEAYSDMALANSITWLATEMSRRSPSLDESYVKLRASVGTRLNRARLLLTNNAPPAKSRVQ